MVATGIAPLQGVSFDQDVNVYDSSTWEPVSVTRIVAAYTGNIELTPPGYGAKDADIGILILDKPIEGITPATLPQPGLLDALKPLTNSRPARTHRVHLHRPREAHP
jgi:hypothetical protein